jgi:DNA polymerase-1
VSLLIDADYIVYKCCAACETEVDFGEDVILVTSRFSDAYSAVFEDLTRIANDLGYLDDSILYFSDSVNFRKLLCPTYKGHRNRKKPCGYKRVIEALKKEFPVVIMSGLEADDAIGIEATKTGGHIIVSPDKDMRQIPGQLYNLVDPITIISPEDGYKWFLIQTMSGDQTDGYSGIPGIGIKRAEALLDKNGVSWKTVVSAFAEKDLDEDVALMNARLAKILTVNDYDFTNQTPKFWVPTDAGSGTQSGAAVQTTSN